MYVLNDTQIDFILNDIKNNGVKMEELQTDLLDHICCVIEHNMKPDDDFETFYRATIKTFYKKELLEIEEETKFLLTFKNYYTMKKIMIISGTFSAAVFILGSLFKIMHWPGASILLVLAMFTMAFIFLPLMSILKSRESQTGRDKLVIASGTLVGILYCVAVLFTVMHWPGARNGMLWLITTSVSLFVFIPVYYFNGIRNPETKTNTIMTTILLIVSTGLHFTLVNLRPANTEIKMYSYVQNERLLQRMLADKKYDNNNFLAADIQKNCVQIKALILKEDIGLDALPKDFESKNLVIDERNISNDFNDNGAGVKLFASLKQAVIKYNQLKTVSSENGIPIVHSVLDIEPEKIGSYSNLFILNGITQLQMFLVTERSKQMALN